MHPHEALVRTFFARLAARDAEAALACYHDRIFYSDPVFPRLHGPAALDLWRMRLARPGFELRLDEASADADGGFARWTLRDACGPRRVELQVRAMFAFRDGRISRHYDHFPFWRWASRAYGPIGAAMGWFGPFKWKVRHDAARALERFSDRGD